MTDEWKVDKVEVTVPSVGNNTVFRISKPFRPGFTDLDVLITSNEDDENKSVKQESTSPLKSLSFKLPAFSLPTFSTSSIKTSDDTKNEKNSSSGVVDKLEQAFGSNDTSETSDEETPKSVDDDGSICVETKQDEDRPLESSTTVVSPTTATSQATTSPTNSRFGGFKMPFIRLPSFGNTSPEATTTITSETEVDKVDVVEDVTNVVDDVGQSSDVTTTTSKTSPTEDETTSDDHKGNVTQTSTPSGFGFRLFSSKKKPKKEKEKKDKEKKSDKKKKKNSQDYKNEKGERLSCIERFLKTFSPYLRVFLSLILEPIGV